MTNKIVNWYIHPEDRKLAALWTALRLPVQWKGFSEAKWIDWTYDGNDSDVVRPDDEGYVSGFKLRLKPE